jgi:hypothetical protein
MNKAHANNDFAQDLTGNIEKLRKIFLANPLTSETLDAIIDAEEEAKKAPATAEGHLGLFWLFRYVSTCH